MKTTKIGRSIIRSLKEIRSWQRGRAAMRLVEVAHPKSPTRIKTIRPKVAKSVRVLPE